ncbi:uncharacterized protein FIBRA_02300 [Fibroporia radiculosa]|uniref:Uncharacterized protein n=1 Tax=Fibroporia radiculosa TaxID=599839 RepID=J4GMS5_9APHY|nr:uncharacterized protein FIBRA_02300 [Fibroporia radiculosa]CCM00270.1 predicted protein [Fibroporia radiculosa]
MMMLDIRIAAFAILSAVVFFGTTYSVTNSTFLDTSNPLLTHLPHPLHATHYFASKANPLNVYFIKRVWGWTSLAFLAHFFTSPRAARTSERVYQYLAATAVWLAFASWFFGPSLIDRLVASTGGECVLNLPSGAIVTLPNEYCFTKSSISISTHSSLFPASLIIPEDSWKGRPRLRRGHDVSGHIFLLAMSILFLVDQLRFSFTTLSATGRSQVWSRAHRWAVAVTAFVISLAMFASYTTSVYFHTPIEKFTGYVLGVGGFAITQLPVFRPAPEVRVTALSEFAAVQNDQGFKKEA